MIRNRTYLYFFRQLIDYVIIIISYLVAAILSINTLPQLHKVNEILLLFLLLLTWAFSSRSTRLYYEFRSTLFSSELIVLLRNIAVQFIVSIVLIFLIKEVQYSRLFVFYYTLLLSILLISEKILIFRLLIWMRKKGRNLRNILIIGAGKVGQQFYYEVSGNPQFGYKIIGFLDDFEIPFSNGLYRGPVSELKNIIQTREIDSVIVALPNYATERIKQVIHICEINGVSVKVIPDYFRYASSKYHLTSFGRFPVVTLKDEKINRYEWRLAKRLFDIVFSFFVITLLISWLYPLISLLIKIESKGPALFKQERWGRNNKRFIVYKFRSMKSDSKDIDENGKFNQAVKDDPRTTKIGKYLRKTNIDEILQFINVLKGEMSVVGPRPHPTPLNLEGMEIIEYYLARQKVKPGLTGWAQVHGLRGETKNPEMMMKRVDHDIWYINNWSMFLDFQIILMTIWYMIKGDPNAY